jgi:hypothetical protein
MRLLHRPTQANKVLPTAVSQWERDELEASASRIRSQFLEEKRDKTQTKAKTAANPHIGEARSLRERILALSLFPTPSASNIRFLRAHGATDE